MQEPANKSSKVVSNVHCDFTDSAMDTVEDQTALFHKVASTAHAALADNAFDECAAGNQPELHNREQAPRYNGTPSVGTVEDVTFDGGSRVAAHQQVAATADGDTVCYQRPDDVAGCKCTESVTV